MTYKQLIKEALTGCHLLLKKHPESKPFLSVQKQLEYLQALEEGNTDDRTRLNDINLGLLAAREVESSDPNLAKILHEISYQLRTIKHNNNIRM